MPRVLHLFNVFGALTERAMLEYTLGLASRGWDITAGYETLADESPAFPLPLAKLQRVQVAPTSDVAAQMEEIATNVPDSERQRLLAEQFDLIHGHFGPRILQGAAWLKRGVRMVVSCYGYDVGRLLRDPCWIERYRWAADHGATFVALAESMRTKLIVLGLPKERVELIRLGIDVASHPYDPQPAPHRPRFVFIGRFVEKKGPDVLVRAMGQLATMPAQIPSAPGPQLDLIGFGPMEQGLRTLVEELHLQESVRFVGAVPFHELFNWLRGATALVQPSTTAADGDAEGAPMVLMHAQAAGLPCITTAHSGNPEVLPVSARRFVVPERDEQALARAMAAMICLSAAQRRQLQEDGRHWIQSRFELGTTLAEYDRLYRSLSSQAPHR
jgi:colanic acid/amylovoran biosynthesis glycosyltransferase